MLGVRKMIKSHEDLIVWKKAYSLVLNLYQATKNFPKSEIYGLTSQIRRSSVSIVANIAEGRGRQYKKEFIQFLHISKGSLEETKVHIRLAKDFGYIKEEEFIEFQKQYDEVGRLLSGLIRSLKNEGGYASTQHLTPST